MNVLHNINTDKAGMRALATYNCDINFFLDRSITQCGLEIQHTAIIIPVSSHHQVWVQGLGEHTRVNGRDFVHPLGHHWTPCLAFNEGAVG